MKKKIISTLVVSALLAIGSECLYFKLVLQVKANGIPPCDAVLVYGGKYSRSVAGLALANKLKAPIFISDAFGGPKDVIQKMGPAQVHQPLLRNGLVQPSLAPRFETSVQVPITVDHFAMTTDQNARNAVQFLKKGGYHRALLVTSWFHMPRALFLTRIYLLGSGISVQPFYYEEVPSNVWSQPDFWGELFRFWGSLVRVALAAVGFEKPWFHYFD